MIRTLAMIAIAGFFVAVLSLSGAAALGGYDLTKNGWSFPVQWDWDDDHERRRPAPHRLEHGRDHQGLPVDRGQPARDRHPRRRHLHPEPDAQAGITGPRDAVEHIIVDDGHIGFTGRGEVRVSIRGANVNVHGLEGFRRLKIEVSAPDVHRFSAGAASNLMLNGVKRDELEIEAHAASHVNGNIDVNRLDLPVHSAANADLEGRADDLDLEVHSAGDAKLGHLAVKSAKVDAHAAGDAEVAPTELAHVEVHSGADVVMRTRPAQLNTNVHSGGDIRFATGATTTTAADRSGDQRADSARGPRGPGAPQGDEGAGAEENLDSSSLRPGRTGPARSLNDPRGLPGSSPPPFLVHGSPGLGPRGRFFLAFRRAWAPDRSARPSAHAPKARWPVR